jgi:alpha-glucosidase (family GH31 glycosyl hydrolase)
MFFFIKGSAKQIIEQYQQMFGLPALPPMWALGWHSSATAFKSLDDIAENVRMYKN